MKHLKYPYSRKKVQQLRFWKQALAKVDSAEAARQLLHGLKGEVRRLAASAAFLLWGAAFFAQSPLHYAKVPVGTFGLPIGPKIMLDVDADSDMDMLTIVAGELRMQINTPLGGVPNFGPPIPNSIGIDETDLSMVATGDLNNDGHLDIVASSISNQLVVYKNSGTAQLSFLEPDMSLSNQLADALGNFGDWDIAQFTGSFILTDIDNDGETDLSALAKWYEYDSPCSTSGGYDWFLKTGWLNMLNNGDSDSLNFTYEYPLASDTILYRRFDLDGDSNIDQCDYTLGGLVLNGFVLGQVKLAGTDEYLNVGLTEDIPVGSVVMDIDGDSDLDVLTTNKVLINMPNHPPTCQDRTVILDIACEQHVIWDYGYGEPYISFYTFFNNNDATCLYENINVAIGHYVKNSDLLNWVNMTAELDLDIYRGIRVLDSVNNNVIMKTDEGSFPCDDFDYEYFEGVHANYIQVIYPLPKYSAYESATQYDLLVQSNNTTSFQFQVSDGAMWSEPCTYTILIDEAIGNVYHDQNANGVQDVGEPPLSGYTLSSAKTGHVYTTDVEGNFNFFFSQFGDTITPFYTYQIASIPPHINYSGGEQNISFGIQLTENIADLRADLTDVTVFRPGFSNTIQLQIFNEGTLPQSATAQLVLPDLLNIWTISPPATTVSGDTLSWQIDDIPTFGHVQFEVLVQVPIGTPLGTPIDCFASVIGNLNETEATPVNNIAELNEQVIGSYDPNDKTAAFGDNVSTWELLSEDEHVYTIRFQNTGTFQADSVAIVDTLDATFDLSTFKIVATSHPMTYIMSEEGVVTFIFDDIFLPDSTTNEPGSHGFVKYSLKTDEPLTLGENIENTAYIYFDFNEAVITNTTNTTVILPETQALTGLVYHDINDDGTQNIGEPAIAAVPLWSAMEATTFLTATDGTFNRPTFPGDSISLDFEAYPFADHTNPPHILMADEDQTASIGVHFGDHTSDAALALTLPVSMMIGQSSLLTCTIQNDGNIAQPMRVELLFEDYFSIAPPTNGLNPTSGSGILTWETPTLQPTESITFELVAELADNPDLVGLDAMYVANVQPMLLFDFVPANNEVAQSVYIQSNLAISDLSGITYHDADDNGQKDVSEPILPNVPLRSELLGSSFNSDANGQFNQLTYESDSITLDAAAYPLADHTNPPFIIKSAIDEVQNIGIHFGAETSNMMAELDGNTILHIGDTLTLSIAATNLGTISQNSQLQLEFPEGLTAQLVTPATGVNLTANSLTWYTDGSNQPYIVEMLTLPGLSPGTVANLKATVTPLAVPDMAPQDNIATLQVTILDSLTQVANMGSDSRFQVQPNPTAADLVVTLDAPNAIGGTFEVFNALGKRVRTTRVKSAQFTLPTDHLPVGVYLAVAKDRDGFLIASVMWTKI